MSRLAARPRLHLHAFVQSDPQRQRTQQHPGSTTPHLYTAVSVSTPDSSNIFRTFFSRFSAGVSMRARLRSSCACSRSCICRRTSASTAVGSAADSAPRTRMRFEIFTLGLAASRRPCLGGFKGWEQHAVGITACRFGFSKHFTSLYPMWTASTSSLPNAPSPPRRNRAPDELLLLLLARLPPLGAELLQLLLRQPQGLGRRLGGLCGIGSGWIGLEWIRLVGCVVGGDMQLPLAQTWRARAGAREGANSNNAGTHPPAAGWAPGARCRSRSCWRGGCPPRGTRSSPPPPRRPPRRPPPPPR